MSIALLNIDECAERLGTTVRQMRTLVFRREIAYLKIGGKLRFDPEDLDKFIAECRVDSVA